VARIGMGETVRLIGLLDGTNASGIARWRDRLLVVSDELTERGNVVQAFEPDGTDYRAAATNGLTVLDLPGARPQEMDLEGLAVDGDDVYAVGSHSATRRKVDPAKTREKNRAALARPPEAKPARDVLLRVRFDAAGQVGPVERSGLRAFLDATEPFRSFGAAAGKENGVDVEGLAVRGDDLFVGFRGPLLRGNFTPVLRCRFGAPVADPEVLYVDLGGRGVRDLAAVGDRLLVLAGPVGDGPGSYQIYLWDGTDRAPGSDVTLDEAGLRLIGDVPLPPASAGGPAPKPEGLAVTEDAADRWTVLVVFDGLRDAHAVRYRVPKA